ncbi:MAG: PhoH-like ATPase [Halanaerobium sp. 4-GBenrich]|jgi:PhoH-like ATPase|uniref:PhoH-like ATPase n=1 Tax=Halanaerobium congolense TaxID=54121 RepID=A0A1G6HS79_9FIRM|nr:PhoH family protein [Halanaerobium congolense]KXS50067.1 MAG: PhoH-like ATPase [Halanaerobium sp. T82-1]ODS50248.1 MAG: PhoH-like ATPase [Halanaerobium sp. 4-GBenrich]PUU92926.1 MAG: PhoH-like ATPase [Halanaerobium sp.]PTX16943.1 PhoH-like ATPase [Halanaerobium congolense]PXV69894.1 PhoH-like ATPase [Halanaerobium congolense]
MKKIFVLDTNVLLNDPRAIYSFEDNDVVIPLAVLEEIDNLKTKSSDLGYNARESSRILEEIRESGNLHDGVELDSGGTVKIIINGKLELPRGLSSSKMDNRIISTAIHLKNEIKKENADRKVIMISDDINMRLICDAYGLEAEEHSSSRLKEEEIYSGFKEIMCGADLINKFYEEEKISLSELNQLDDSLYPNEFVQLTADDRNKNTALARFDGENLVPLRYNKSQPAKIRARNREQQMAMELLLDDEIKLVTMSGKAGTGKTLLALAAGLAKVVDEQSFSKLLVARPIQPMGKELGFLPGDVEEKMGPWMKPIFDNLDFIVHRNKDAMYAYQKLLDKDLIQVEALTYIRGRSVPDQFIVIDEAQNLSLHEVKTIVTRAGEGSKLIFTGDPFQIDNPYLNFHKNGLNYLAHKFHDQKIAGHIMLKEGERSELAEIASNLL